MSSCGVIMRVCHKSINRLEKATIPFNSLPVEIKEYFYIVSTIKTRTEIDEFFNNSKNVPPTEKGGFTPELFTFNTAYEYEFKIVNVFRNSDIWISHYLLIDNE